MIKVLKHGIKKTKKHVVTCSCCNCKFTFNYDYDTYFLVGTLVVDCPKCGHKIVADDAKIIYE